MGIGTGIFLFVVGAILTFALRDDLAANYVNLDAIGIILMVAGAVVAIISAILMTRKQRSISTTRSTVDVDAGQRIDQHETLHTGDPMV